MSDTSSELIIAADPEDTIEAQAPTTHKGLPLIDQADYELYYNVDASTYSTPEHPSSTTFNFQGYVRRSDGKILYKDALATNGILQERFGGRGIHVGTDGIQDYSQNDALTLTPESVGEYDIYISIPSEVQKGLRVYCKYDSCMSVDNAAKHFDEPASVKSAQSEDGFIVIRTMLNPQGDPLARARAHALQESIVQYINDDRPLDRLKDFIEGKEEQLSRLNSPEELCFLTSGNVSQSLLN